MSDIKVPEFNQVIATLNQSKLQITNPPAYEAIKSLIDLVKRFADGVTTGTNTNTNEVTTLSQRTYLTSAPESAFLPFSRNLLAGTNVSFNDAVANQRTINVTASGTGFANIFLLMGA